MNRPVIGITPSHQNEFKSYKLNKNYCEAVLKAGGLPLILPITTEEGVVANYFSLINGLIISGGLDVDSLIYKENPLPGLGDIDPERDQFELDLFKRALESSIPILGICRGCQLINVASGGTLYQDIQKKGDELVIKHQQDAPRWHPTHSVKIEKDSTLFKFLKQEKIMVNSFHHQAVKDVALGYKVIARADDGIIEAIEKEGKDFVLGVQWHPEGMFEKDKVSLFIFKKLVDRCRKEVFC